VSARHCLVASALLAGIGGCHELSGPSEASPDTRIGYQLTTVRGSPLPQLIAQGTDAAGAYKYAVSAAKLALTDGDPAKGEFEILTGIQEVRSTLTASHVLTDVGAFSVTADTLRLTYGDGAVDVGVFSDTTAGTQTFARFNLRFTVPQASGPPLEYYFRRCNIAEGATPGLQTCRDP
jgi:hypothetical protein